MPYSRNQLLQAMLEEVSFTGWSQQSLKKAAQNLGLDGFDLYRLVPEGAAELLEDFQNNLDQAMLHRIAEDTGWQQRKIRDRIAQAVMWRFEAAAPQREAVRRAVAYYLLHPLTGSQRCFETASTIWYAAGDTSTDMNYYSKRTLLSAVYSSSLLVWLNDESDGFSITRAFLERRIENVMMIPKLKQRHC